MASGGEGTGENEEDLARRAREEILVDTSRAKTRAETVGTLGWSPCPLPKANKRFIGNMLVGIIQANRRCKSQEKKEKALLKVDLRNQTERLHRRGCTFRRYRNPSSLESHTQSRIKTEKRTDKSKVDGSTSSSNHRTK